MTTRSICELAAGLAALLLTAPASAQEADHSGHQAHHAGHHAPAGREAVGPESVLVAYRNALEEREADAMADLFAQSSMVFENGKAEGSFSDYMEHHLGPELDAIVSFSFTDPTVAVTRNGHLAYGYETYGYRIELEDGRIIERDGVATSVLIHDASGWQIVQYHSSSRAPRN